MCQLMAKLSRYHTSRDCLLVLDLAWSNISKVSQFKLWFNLSLYYDLKSFHHVYDCQIIDVLSIFLPICPT